jgi:hypothetical protein
VKTKFLSTLCFIFLPSSFILSAFAQGTAFTYQGRLNDGSIPAAGAYDLRFRLASDALGNNFVGGAVLTNGVTVSGGLFAVTLDFGSGIFTGSNLWLQVDVRTNGGGSYTTLVPLQALTPTPYAIMAGSASNLLGLLSATQLSGALASAQLSGTYTGAVTFNNASNSFSGSGAGLAGVNAGTLNGLTSSNFWQLGGNAGTTPGAHFLGTADNKAFELKVNGTRVLRLEPSGDSILDADSLPDGAPNVVGGSPTNFVAAGVVGATISGGGATNYLGFSYPNSVLADYASIGGGLGNTIHDFSFAATIGGGAFNTIRTNSFYGTIGGGLANMVEDFVLDGTIGGGENNLIGANAWYSTIGGGQVNRILANATYGTIGGGFANIVSGSSATVPGGRQNEARGANSFAAGLRAKANHTGAFVWGDSTDVDFASTANNQFLIRASGGVGIGTTAPEGDLHVFRGSAGAVTASSAAPLVIESDTNAFIHVLTPGNALSGILFGSPGNSVLDASIRYNNSADRELSFRTLNSTRMVITTNGNVGIGTASPGSTLRVQGAGILGDIWLSPTTSGGNADLFLSETASGSFGIKLRHNGANNLLEFIGVNSSVETSPLMTIGRGASSGVSIANELIVNGNIGIGISNPTSRLHVEDAVGGNGSVVLPNNSIAAAEVFDEPGVAGDAEGVNAAALTPSVQALLSQSITVPTAGFVLVLGTCQATANHVNGTQSMATFGVSSNTTSFPSSQDVQVSLPSSAVSGGYNWAVAVHGLFSVASAGSHTFSLLAQETSAQWSASEMQLTLVFFPTSYGTVTSTLTGSSVEQSAVAAEESASGPSTAASDASQQVEQPAMDKDREIAALKLRLERLERLIQVKGRN